MSGYVVRQGENIDPTLLESIGFESPASIEEVSKLYFICVPLIVADNQLGFVPVVAKEYYSESDAVEDLRWFIRWFNGAE